MGSAQPLCSVPATSPAVCSVLRPQSDSTMGHLPSPGHGARPAPHVVGTGCKCHRTWGQGSPGMLAERWGLHLFSARGKEAHQTGRREGRGGGWGVATAGHRPGREVHLCDLRGPALPQLPNPLTWALLAALGPRPSRTLQGVTVAPGCYWTQRHSGEGAGQVHHSHWKRFTVSEMGTDCTYTSRMRFHQPTEPTS